jgi:hypothetical protein
MFRCKRLFAPFSLVAIDINPLSLTPFIEQKALKIKKIMALQSHNLPVL